MGSTLEPNNLLIVTELMKRGSVYDLLHDADPLIVEQLTLKKRMRMARDAAEGCNWLHMSRPVLIHRDLKASTSVAYANSFGRPVTSWWMKIGMSKSVILV